jgi:nitronate monooxygenase
MGTAFLAATEAGTHPAHQAALLAADDEATALTRAFSGRTARGLRNRFMAEWAGRDAELLPFPIQNALTRDIRQAAAKQNRPELLSMWAGQGAGMARRASVQELVDAWVTEAEAVIKRLSPS